jgi:hypothetical protein
VVTTDGTGVVSHAGTVLLAELADRIGLTAALNEATDGLRERRSGHDPARVLVDVAVAIADGAPAPGRPLALGARPGPSIPAPAADPAPGLTGPAPRPPHSIQPSRRRHRTPAGAPRCPGTAGTMTRSFGASETPY